MTVLERVKALLARIAPNAAFHDCIAKALGMRQTQMIATTTASLRSAFGK
jgi:hypothetical protein